MTQERLDYLLEQHYKGELSGSEQRELDRWYQDMQNGHSGLYSVGRSDAEQRELTEMADGLMLRVEETERFQLRSKRRAVVLRWSVAASVVLVLGLFLIFSLSDKKDDVNVLQIASAEDGSTYPQMIVTLENNAGIEEKYTLPDGTSVSLSPTSVITYGSNYNVSNRELTLKGKAFFKVKKDPAKPFIVYSKNIATTALGTSFYVTAYESDTTVHVLLQEGRVSVKPVEVRDRVVYLDPGYTVSFNTNTLIASAVMPVAKQNDRELVAVKRAGLVNAGTPVIFEQQPLHKVLDELALIYKVAITYNLNEIRDLDFSGTVKPGDHLMPVLQRIGLLNNLSVKSSNGKYVITSQ
ncbi:FecR domain-containing protein [Terrimonas sp. NA20]|uniref:FecR domain-containing protein n=1 Tax=Terrimonas ginsenosidimutans TaxID=2908004 RepID=A0ABS9KLU6_9BACT|nr:FecR family protein [Terrimonas ginsenosidimutans]MCG2613300.1 FecR domain-containing protein [Terrimonas ginsenosidimutans]